jgi:periplasmic protein CpxP/Spy
MKAFRTHLLIGIAALSLGAGSVAAPADAPARDKGCWEHMGGAEHGRFAERMREHMAKRAAELHDKLKLNASQEMAWNTYMAKVKPDERAARPDRAELDKLTAPERMDWMLAHMKEHEKRMEDRAAATKEFYAVLTPQQKKIFDDEFRRGPGHRDKRR